MQIPKFKSKILGIFLSIVCMVVLLAFLVGILVGLIGGKEYDLFLMKVGIGMCVISGICMGILHIIYFRTPNRLKNKLFK